MIRDCVRSNIRDSVIDIDGVLGDFSVLSLNPLAWYDLTDTLTLTSSNDFVSQAYDKSGNNHHLTESTPGKQPLITSDGLYFDGIDDELSALNVINDGSQTAFVVYKYHDPLDVGGAAARDVLLANHGSGGDKNRFYLSTDGVDFGNSKLLHSNTSINTDYILSAWSENIGDGSTQTIQINNGTPVSGQVDRGLTDSTLSVASQLFVSDWLECTIKEIIIFDRVLSADNRSDVQSYLTSKHNL